MTTEVRDVTDVTGNIVALEHVNVQVPDQGTARKFYVDTLGLTRDPEQMTGAVNMWINVGQSQFHLPSGEAQVLRGHVGLVLPDRARLLARLSVAKSDFADTSFAFVEDDAFVDVTTPWGNRLRCFGPSPRFGDVSLGMAYVEFDVLTGTAEPIADFYRELLGARCEVVEDASGRFATCSVGSNQQFLFRERDGALPDYDGHHVQVYLADIAGPLEKLQARGLVYEVVEHQFRFKDIVDPDDNEVLFTIEHEIRSTAHPMFNRTLFNRVLD